MGSGIAAPAKASCRNGVKLLPVRSAGVVRTVPVPRSGNALTSANSYCWNVSYPGYWANSHKSNWQLLTVTAPGGLRQPGAGTLPRSLNVPVRYTIPLSWTVLMSVHWFASLPVRLTMSLPGTGPATNLPIRGANCWRPYRHQALRSVTARKAYCWLLPVAGLILASNAVCSTSG